MSVTYLPERKARKQREQLFEELLSDIVDDEAKVIVDRMIVSRNYALEVTGVEALVVTKSGDQIRIRLDRTVGLKAKGMRGKDG